MQVNFMRQYTTPGGGMIMRFMTDSGQSAEIKVRRDRSYAATMLFTRAEAKAIATVHFLGLCAGPDKCPVTVH